MTRRLLSFVLAAVLLFCGVIFTSCQKKTDEPGFTTVISSEMTKGESEAPVTTKYINPLTGLETSEELVGKRPVAIMINNIHIACPQQGISGADIIYEAMAEGGITRLMAVTLDYSSLGVTGSIRSSREYYLDLAANHDAIYIHAGGAESAYEAMNARGVEHLDGVRGGGEANAAVFYRDEERMNNMGYEHSMMTTGERLKTGISLSGFRTDLYGDFKQPFTFTDSVSDIEWTQNIGNICLTYNDYQQVFYKYSNGKYLRYQNYGTAQIDGNTGEQLAFDNLLFIACPHGSTGDNYGHIYINTVGSGDAFYVREGRLVKLIWHKESVTSPISFTYENGREAKFVPGKFMIQIADPTVFWQTDFYSDLQY